ncbi:acyltransferase family protein [Streptomyces halobius]|uniref:Acyltransferase n=1 Tax=Streptomyces halobius TaxID=2879846 RepID=A0ABY4MHY9_9ACTN|nr:acyltransferase [Streptomyces halobius]UQA97416.1 acyltransferase [Streptomyces halobius]
MRPFPRPPSQSLVMADRALSGRLDDGTAKERTRSGPGRLPSLTGLRFIAAGGVVYTHCAFLIHPHSVQTIGLHEWVGGSSVSLFFILSGYVLVHSARPTDTARGFWRRRAAKVLPNHVVTWSLMMVALAGAGAAAATSNAGLEAHLSSLFLVHSWIPSQRFVTAGNPVAWSLAAEMFFYLLFPVLQPWIERLTLRGLLVGSGFALALVWTWPVLCEGIINTRGAFFPEYWFLYVLPLTRLPEFVLGMMAARISATGFRLPRIGVLPAALGVIGTIVVGDTCLPPRFMYAAATAFPLVLLVYATAELDLRGRPSLLRTRPLVFLGEISYAIYLTHFLVLGSVNLAPKDHVSRVWVVVIGVPVVLLASWLLYVRVERPCVRRLSASRARTRARAATTS